MELSDFTMSPEDPMTDDRMALIEALQKAESFRIAVESENVH